MTSELTYTVPGITCSHCAAAISGEVAQVAGVATVDVDVDRKTVAVRGAGLSDEAVRAAIGDAGYEATA
jgi:copper chaperone